MNKLSVIIGISTILLIATTQKVKAAYFDFVQTGWTGGGTLTGFFEGEDLNNNNTILYPSTPPDELREFFINWSGNAIIPAFSGNIADLSNFIYRTAQNDFVNLVYFEDITIAGPSVYTTESGRGGTIFITSPQFPQINTAQDPIITMRNSNPGSSQGNPVLPDITTVGRFIFEDVNSGLWFDPPFTDGFNYEITSLGSLFDKITFPIGFTDSFDLSSGGVDLGSFNGGDMFDFAGSGVTEFTISGINPLVDSALGDAFPLQIFFNNPTDNSFTMEALVNQESIPEPSTIIGLGTLATFGIGTGLRRKLAKAEKK